MNLTDPKLLSAHRNSKRIILSFRTPFVLRAHLRCLIMLCLLPAHYRFGPGQRGMGWPTDWLRWRLLHPVDQCRLVLSAPLFTYLPQHSDTLLNKEQPISSMDLKCQSKSESRSWKQVNVWCLQWKRVNISIYMYVYKYKIPCWNKCWSFLLYRTLTTDFS